MFLLTFLNAVIYFEQFDSEFHTNIYVNSLSEDFYIFSRFSSIFQGYDPCSRQTTVQYYMSYIFTAYFFSGWSLRNFGFHMLNRSYVEFVGKKGVLRSSKLSGFKIILTTLLGQL